MLSSFFCRLSLWLSRMFFCFIGARWFLRIRRWLFLILFRSFLFTLRLFRVSFYLFRQSAVECVGLVLNGKKLSYALSKTQQQHQPTRMRPACKSSKQCTIFFTFVCLFFVLFKIVASLSSRSHSFTSCLKTRDHIFQHTNTAIIAEITEQNQKNAVAISVCILMNFVLLFLPFGSSLRLFKMLLECFGYGGPILCFILNSFGWIV